MLIDKASGTAADYFFIEKNIICSFVVELPGNNNFSLREE